MFSVSIQKSAKNFCFFNTTRKNSDFFSCLGKQWLLFQVPPAQSTPVLRKMLIKLSGFQNLFAKVMEKLRQQDLYSLSHGLGSTC